MKEKRCYTGICSKDDYCLCGVTASCDAFTDESDQHGASPSIQLTGSVSVKTDSPILGRLKKAYFDCKKPC